MLKNILLLIPVALVLQIAVHGQQQVQFSVSPKVSKAVKGHKTLDRRKYFNLAANVLELERTLTAQQENYYMNDLGMTLGRRLGMVGTEWRYSRDNIREDANRPGYADTAYYKSRNNPNKRIKNPTRSEVKMIP